VGTGQAVGHERIKGEAEFTPTPLPQRGKVGEGVYDVIRYIRPQIRTLPFVFNVWLLPGKELKWLDMNLFAILLIENMPLIAEAVVQAIGQHLSDYRLIITPGLAEAVAETEPTQVILLNVTRLAEDVCSNLNALSTIYPGAPIILLHDVSAPVTETEEQNMLDALAWGVTHYYPLTKIGLVALANQLAGQQSTWQAQQSEPTPTSSALLYQAIISDTSQLAIQIVGLDNRIRAWNRAAEILFGLNTQHFGSFLIESLPLSPPNLSRLKDILEQVRSSGEPLFIPNFALEKQQGETYWVQLHLYPIYAEPSLLTDICIISADVTDLKLTEIRQGHYSQELQILLETSRQISGRLELLPTLEKIVEQTKVLLNADNGRIYFLEKDQDVLQPILSIGPLPEQEYPPPIPLGQAPIGAVAISGQAVMVNLDSSINETPIREYLLCVPLTAFKEIMGVMVISRLNKSPFGQDDLRFLESIVKQVSASIYNARRFEETRNNLNELTLLYETSSAIATARNTEAILGTLLQKMAQALNVSAGHIVSWEKRHQTGTVLAEFLADGALSHPRTETGRSFSLAQRPALRPIQHQQPLVFQVSDPALDEVEHQEMVKWGCVSRLLVPLVVKDEAIGWAELWELHHERIFTSDEIRLARMLANQAAVALENLQYLKQTQQALEETGALYHVASALASTQDAQTIMSTVLHEYLRALDLKQGSVIIFDFERKLGVVQVNFQDDQPASLSQSPVEETEIEGRPTLGLEGWELPLRNNPIYERLMATHQPVIIEDTQGKLVSFLPKAIPPLPTLIRLGWAGPETLSLLVIPIQIRGEIIGVLAAEATRYKQPFNAGEIALGQAMADQLGLGLQNVELFEAEYQRRQQAETLREVSFVVSSSLNLNEVLERILDQLARVIQYDSAAIHLIEGSRRRIIAGRGFPNLKKVIGLTFPVKLDTKQDPSALVIQNRQPLVVGNVRASYNVADKSPYDNIKSWMGIPLIARDKVIGLISINHTEANAYDEDDLRLALAFANQVAIALENARLYEIEVREFERELEIAQSIQETLLPQLVPQVAGLEISGRILPARHIGGDFFHFFSVGKDQLGVAIGDVSGKGIPAALYMAVAITAIDAQIRADVGPGELLNELNHILYNRLRENKMNVALQVATFSPLSSDNKEAEGILMTVASAGMIAPIGATEHGCHFLPVSGLPVGALSPPEQNYHDDTFLLDPFTTIIFTSDGIVEAQNETRELFGFERLEQTINEIIKTRDAEVIADYIINTTQKFVGQAEQNDDMTVVVVVKK
jgi:PAS domain S-box-containing protein